MNIPFFFFFLSGRQPQHMEVPSLGAESELQLLAYTTATTQPEGAASMIYTPQFVATPDPQPTEQDQGSNLHLMDTSQVLHPLSHNRNSS